MLFCLLAFSVSVEESDVFGSFVFLLKIFRILSDLKFLNFHMSLNVFPPSPLLVTPVTT